MQHNYDDDDDGEDDDDDDEDSDDGDGGDGEDGEDSNDGGDGDGDGYHGDGEDGGDDDYCENYVVDNEKVGSTLHSFNLRRLSNIIELEVKLSRESLSAPTSSCLTSPFFVPSCDPGIIDRNI